MYAQLYVRFPSPDATCGSGKCAHNVLVMPLIHLFFSFLFFPQALQPHTEKARRAQGTGQRAELPVYSCQNTGGWVNLLCATGSIAEHFDGRVCHCL